MSSRRQLTLAALAGLLEEISVANGFNTDAGEMVVLSHDLELGENDPPAAICIVSGVESFSQPQMRKLFSQWPISIRAVVKADLDDPYVTAELVVADIEKAIEVEDPTFGYLVNDNGNFGLILQSIETVQREAGSSVVGIDVVFIAKLQRAWGDPLGTAQELVMAS